MRKCQRRQIGFSLIELIVAIVLMSIISVAASRFYLQGVNAAQSQRNITDVSWQARFAMEHMLREIRLTRSPSDISTLPGNTFTFTDINGNQITYSLSGTTLNRNGIALATGITNLAFSFQNTAGVAITTIANVATIGYVTITLTSTQRNITTTLTSSVYLRDIST